MGRNKDSLIALAEKLTGETCGNVLTKKDALKKIACFYAGQEVECNTVADALQCIASHCNGGGGGDVISYLRAYDTSAEVSNTRLYMTKDTINTYDYFLTNSFSGISKDNIVVEENGFTIDNATYTRTRGSDRFMGAKDEQVEVEFVSGYDFGITTFNFLRSKCNKGTVWSNYRFGGSSRYDASIECDLCVYKNGDTGYYKIKQ